jgi:hypothetical protein
MAMMPDKAGAALNTFRRVYYNIADFEELQKILGKDAALFSQEQMLLTRNEIALETWETDNETLNKEEYAKIQASGISLNFLERTISTAYMLRSQIVLFA